MSIRLDKCGEVNVLLVDGELVSATRGDFCRVVERCRQSDGRDFVIDMSRVTLVDSAGLEALTALQRECQENLGMLKLCGVDATLGKILEMTRLNRSLECCPDVDAALASICGK